MKSISLFLENIDLRKLLNQEKQLARWANQELKKKVLNRKKRR